MPIDLVIDEREGGTKMEGLSGETISDLRTALTSSSRCLLDTNLAIFPYILI